MLKLLLLILILSSLFCFYLRDLRFASEANFDAYGDPSQIGTISDPSLT